MDGREAPGRAIDRKGGRIGRSSRRPQLRLYVADGSGLVACSPTRRGESAIRGEKRRQRPARALTTLAPTSPVVTFGAVNRLVIMPSRCSLRSRTNDTVEAPTVQHCIISHQELNLVLRHVSCPYQKLGFLLESLLLQPTMSSLLKRCPSSSPS